MSWLFVQLKEDYPWTVTGHYRPGATSRPATMPHFAAA